jgi:hypothetical protein
MSHTQHTRPRPQRKRIQRTAIVFFGLTVQEYLQVAGDRGRYVAVVAKTLLGCATLQHHPGCAGTGRFTRHHHYLRTAQNLTLSLYGGRGPDGLLVEKLAVGPPIGKSACGHRWSSAASRAKPYA